MERRKTRIIHVGNTTIGGGHPIAVQSMTNVDSHDAQGVIKQTRALALAGCDIVRVAVPDSLSVGTIAALKKEKNLPPIVADIHFDYRLALACIEVGVDKIRLNPGNIGSIDRVEAVAKACKERNVPIRIGVNAGSLEKHILEKYKKPCAEALAESAMFHIGILENLGFYDVAVSVKASTVKEMIAANRLLAHMTDCPIHLGVTEAGGAHIGSIKNAVGIGTLLAEGIGDTLRVSLTADPVLEVKEGRAILSVLGLSEREMEIVSCPTCGRTGIDLIALLEAFENEVDKHHLRKMPLKVAIMGCVVNGPGEAREADIGIAGGKGECVLFRHGVVVEKVPEDKIIARLIAEIKALAE